MKNNWWNKWRWFKSQGIGNYYFHDGVLSNVTTYFYYTDGEKRIKMGEMTIRRDWIEKL